MHFERSPVGLAYVCAYVCSYVLGMSHNVPGHLQRNGINCERSELPKIL